MKGGNKSITSQCNINERECCYFYAWHALEITIHNILITFIKHVVRLIVCHIVHIVCCDVGTLSELK